MNPGRKMAPKIPSRVPMIMWRGSLRKSRRRRNGHPPQECSRRSVLKRSWICHKANEAGSKHGRLSG